MDERAAHSVVDLLALDRGQKADRPEVDPEHGHAAVGVVAQRVQDAAVAAKHDADVRFLGKLLHPADPLGGVTVLLVHVRGSDQLDAGGLRSRGRGAHPVR